MSEIATFIAAQVSPRSAERVVTYIRNAALALETLPEMGVALPEHGIREFILTRYPYVLVYELADDEVRILAVFHQAQDRR
ncbi:MAG: type II toxin-antitoxin system RelE/ParE family toxin [Hyphomonadaceae bacterium]|nr:type II toxin-antitoxin system RelE/ParE family toxin [Hyphomonadaceae bacterium]